MRPKRLLPIGTHVEYRDDRTESWSNRAKVHGYDLGGTKYHLCNELWDGSIMQVPTVWAFTGNVRLAKEERVMEFQVNERVDVLLKDVRIHRINGKEMTVAVGYEVVTFNLGYEEVDVTRVCPAEWPPQQGDLWEDATGVRWFAIRWSTGTLAMHPDGDARDGSSQLLNECSVESLLEERADLRLVTRRVSDS